MFDSLRNQRGVVLTMIGVAFTAIFAATAIGLGVGRLTLAATEVQNAADVAAISGAMAMHKFEDPRIQAEAALAGNEIAMGSATQYLEEIVVGFYDYPARLFIAGGEPRNSVKARVRAPIDNVFGALIQRPIQDVEKIAYAALTGLRGGRPTLPIVMGSCNFVQDCMHDSCMPRLTQVPNTTDSAGWTAFFETTSATSTNDFIPAPCGGGASVDVWVDDVISVNNGQITSTLQKIKCLIDLGMVQHLIPVVPCEGSFNQAKPILGFATIVIENVVTAGDSKGVDLRAVFKSDAVGVMGGSLFGTGNIALVPISPI